MDQRGTDATSRGVTAWLILANIAGSLQVEMPNDSLDLKPTRLHAKGPLSYSQPLSEGPSLKIPLPLTKTG